MDKEFNEKFYQILLLLSVIANVIAIIGQYAAQKTILYCLGK